MERGVVFSKIMDFHGQFQRIFFCVADFKCHLLICLLPIFVTISMHNSQSLLDELFQHGSARTCGFVAFIHVNSSGNAGPNSKQKNILGMYRY
jgi:hypothetical protein